MLGGRREQGGEHVGRGELVEMADLQRGFGIGAEALAKVLGAQQSWQGWPGLGLPWEGREGFCVCWEWEKRGKKSLPSLRPLLGCLCGLGRGQQNQRMLCGMLGYPYGPAAGPVTTQPP